MRSSSRANLESKKVKFHALWLVDDSLKSDAAKLRILG